jgi:hypothetical protein
MSINSSCARMRKTSSTARQQARPRPPAGPGALRSHRSRERRGEDNGKDKSIEVIGQATSTGRRAIHQTQRATFALLFFHINEYLSCPCCPHEYCCWCWISWTSLFLPMWNYSGIDCCSLFGRTSMFSVALLILPVMQSFLTGENELCGSMHTGGRHSRSARPLLCSPHLGRQSPHGERRGL